MIKKAVIFVASLGSPARRCAAWGGALLGCFALLLTGVASADDENGAKNKRGKPEEPSTARPTLATLIDPPAAEDIVPSSPEALAAAAADRQDTRGAFYEQPLRLYDVEGRLLEARLVSAAGEMITVERVSDGAEFQIELDRFHESSRRYIDMWLSRDADAVDYSFGFVTKKRMVDSSDFESTGRTLTTTEWVYDIELTNRTRNALEGAEIEYKVFYDDEVNFVRTSAYPGQGLAQDGDAVKLPLLEFNARAEFTIPGIELNTYRYSPTKGENEYHRDRIVGIWLRLVKNDEVIAEYQSQPTVMKEFSWDGEKEVTVKVTDSFADEFEGRDDADDTRLGR